MTAGTLKEVTEERFIDYYGVPDDKPTVIEFTEQFEPENRIRILAEGLPALPPAVEKIGADKYKGPGLVIQWVDVEGRLLASWPPPSHKAIFGDLKRAVAPSANDPKRLEVVSQQPMMDAERILRDFDRTTVFLGSNLGDGSCHSTRNLPVLLAAGGFKRGQHLPFDQQNPPPLCNLYVSMLQRLDIEADKFGTSTGTFTGLELSRG